MSADRVGGIPERRLQLGDRCWTACSGVGHGIPFSWGRSASIHTVQLDNSRLRCIHGVGVHRKRVDQRGDGARLQSFCPTPRSRAVGGNRPLALRELIAVMPLSGFMERVRHQKARRGYVFREARMLGFAFARPPQVVGTVGRQRLVDLQLPGNDADIGRVGVAIMFVFSLSGRGVCRCAGAHPPPVVCLRRERRKKDQVVRCRLSVGGFLSYRGWVCTCTPAHPLTPVAIGRD